MSLCPDNVILAGFLGSFAPCPVSALAGYHDGDVICLRRQPVNNPHPTCSLIHLSHLRDGIRMVASCRPRGTPGLPLLRKGAEKDPRVLTSCAFATVGKILRTK